MTIIEQCDQKKYYSKHLQKLKNIFSYVLFDTFLMSDIDFLSMI